MRWPLLAGSEDKELCLQQTNERARPIVYHETRLADERIQFVIRRDDIQADRQRLAAKTHRSRMNCFRFPLYRRIKSCCRHFSLLRRECVARSRG